MIGRSQKKNGKKKNTLANSIGTSLSERPCTTQSQICSVLYFGFINLIVHSSTTWNLAPIVSAAWATLEFAPVTTPLTA